MKTTREEAQEKSRENLVDNLQALLEKNYDAEKGFKNALTNAKNDHLKDYLKQQAVKRNRFATELDKQIRTLNEKPKESGSIKGSLHRTWMDIKSSVAGDNDEAVLEECIRGDKASAEEYKEVLQANHIPSQIQGVLTNQLNEIESTISKVRSLENLAENNKL